MIDHTRKRSARGKTPVDGPDSVASLSVGEGTALEAGTLKAVTVKTGFLAWKIIIVTRPNSSFAFLPPVHFSSVGFFQKTKPPSLTRQQLRSPESKLGFST